MTSLKSLLSLIGILTFTGLCGCGFRASNPNAGRSHQHLFFSHTNGLASTYGNIYACRNSLRTQRELHDELRQRRCGAAVLQPQR